MVRTGVIWIYRLRDSEDPNVDPVAHFDLTNPATSATDERAISRTEYYSDPDWATTVSGRGQLGDPAHRRAASRVERSAVGLACGRTSSRGCPPRATTTIPRSGRQVGRRHRILFLGGRVFQRSEERREG